MSDKTAIPPLPESGLIKISGAISLGTPKMSKLFWHVKGTHQMNSKEMSRIIDSLVFDCREHGLKTKSDLEFERIMQAWEKIEKNT